MTHCDPIGLEMDTTCGIPGQSTALKSTPAGAWRFVTRLIGRPILRRLQRRQFRKLHDLDDHMLDDIGVTRDELNKVSKMPLSVDAATELQRRSITRRRKEFRGELPR